jgi:chemotaxis protein MotA
MNFSTLVGFIFSAVVFLGAIITSSDNFFFFFNPHAILIVLGGTMAVTLICFPLPRLIDLLKVFFKRMLGKNRKNYIEIIEDIVKLANSYEQGYQKFAQTIEEVKDPFLFDSAKVLEWGEAEISEDHLRELLENRADTFYARYMKEAGIFRTISKFPPAFGLLGTTLGMISLMQSLGPGAEGNIGSSMAIALVATLYGVAASNLIFIPIAENLSEQTEDDQIARRIVVEGVMMIYKGVPVQFIEENAKSFLLPKERGDQREAKA